MRGPGSGVVGRWGRFYPARGAPRKELLVGRAGACPTGPAVRLAFPGPRWAEWRFEPHADTGSGGTRMHDSILQAIGKTPLVRLRRLAEGVTATVAVKVESLEPGGSVKDRVGLAMILEAERRGLLRPGGTI